MEMPRKLLGMGPLLRALVPYHRIFGDNAHPSRVNFKTVWESWWVMYKYGLPKQPLSVPAMAKEM
jgi:hypothetical protein